MAEDQETITISLCPKCSGSHKYWLVVKRATALSVSEVRPRPAQRRFTRLFTCPVTRDDFQADLVIEETGHNEIIVALQIGDVVTEDQANE